VNDAGTLPMVISEVGEIRGRIRISLQGDDEVPGPVLVEGYQISLVEEEAHRGPPEEP